MEVEQSHASVISIQMTSVPHKLFDPCTIIIFLPLSILLYGKTGNSQLDALLRMDQVICEDILD